MLRDRAGRAIMALLSLSALGAAAMASFALSEATDASYWVDVWRAAGLVVFAGLFAVLAWRPRRSPLIWELVFFHKAALVVAAVVRPDAAGVASDAVIDLGLCLFTLAGWGLTRGWRSWFS